VKEKIPADDKTKLEAAIEETISWLDSNASAEKEEYEDKQKALEAIAMPVLQSMAGGAGCMPDMGGMPDMCGSACGAPPTGDPVSGPTIEEISLRVCHVIVSRENYTRYLKEFFVLLHCCNQRI